MILDQYVYSFTYSYYVLDNITHNHWIFDESG